MNCGPIQPGPDIAIEFWVRSANLQGPLPPAPLRQLVTHGKRIVAAHIQTDEMTPI
jgi:hypothetical protein